jgi:hypothetical protein
VSDVSVQPGETPDTPESAPASRTVKPAGRSTRFASAPAEPEPQPARGWLLPALIALVIGAGATVGVLYFAGWRPAPNHEYSVLVVLKQDVTEDQRTAAKATLEKLPGRTGDVRLVSKAEAFAEAQKAYAGTDALKDMTEQKMPESIRVISSGQTFDCAPLKPLTGNAGVSKLSIVQPATSDEPGATISC